jgi:hypothetical protein
MRILLSAVTAAAVLGTAAAGAPPASTRFDSPRLSEITRGAAFRDATLPSLSRRLAAFPNVPTWNYQPTVAGGQTVSIHLSMAAFPASDPATAQKWADFFGSLIHGSELSDLSAYFLTSAEVQRICGRQALACYGNDELAAPADDPSIDLSAEAVATHEYGHHVADHRRNDPWVAVDTGPKRWASYEQVCARSKSGQLFPGAEDERHYMVNPGEGWAETYRVLNEHRLGLFEPAWNIVTESLYPDSRALTVAEQDVTSPWTKPTALIHKGSVRKTRSFIVSTPLDGRVTISLRASSRDKLDLFAPSSARLRHAIGKTASVSTTVCGQRALRVRVSGAGSFRLAISKP